MSFDLFREYIRICKMLQREPSLTGARAFKEAFK